MGDDVTYEEFKQVYMDAFNGGAKGCTTFRASGKRFGIFNAPMEKEEKDEIKIKSVTKKSREEEEAILACFIDPLTGLKGVNKCYLDYQRLWSVQDLEPLLALQVRSGAKTKK